MTQSEATMVRKRDPERTRAQLIQAAFNEMHTNGYTAAGIDRIIERSGVTKGAFYHHFSSKKELAQAVIDGVIRTTVVEAFISPLEDTHNPIDGIQECLTYEVGRLTPKRVACGCPLNNFAQELAGTDDDFQEQIDGLYGHWCDGIAAALVRGQDAGQVRLDIDPKDVATFTVAAIAGTAGFAKSARDVEVAQTSVRVLCSYLETLRTAPK